MLRMYNSNEALKALTDALANIVEVQVDSVSKDRVSLYGVRGKITFGIFFDTQKQLFGFNLLTGGVKTFKSIEQFVAMFDTYAYINVVFIPKAKFVADTFEKELALNSVYKTFVGNKNVGFSAIFQVLGADTQLLVTECKEENEFKADYVQPTTGGDKTVIREMYFVIKVDEDGEMYCHRKVSVEDIIDILKKKSWEDADQFLDFKALEGGIFEVTMKDFSYRMEVEITAELEIVYKLIAVNGNAIDPHYMHPGDWQDLSSISSSTVSLYENVLKPAEEPEIEEEQQLEETSEEIHSTEEDIESTEEVPEEIPESTEDVQSDESFDADESTEEEVSAEEDSVEEDSIEKEVSTEEDTADEEVAEDVQQGEETAEEDVVEDPVEEVSEEETASSIEDSKEEIGTVSEELSLSLAYKGGECQGVLASHGNKLFLFDLDLVSSSSLYLDRIIESEEMETKAGVAMYPSERKQMRFAKRGTKEDLDAVIALLFGF